MKLAPESIAYILNVVKTAKMVGIDSVIIEDGLVRGMDDDNSVVLFQNENVHELECGSVGLTRLDVLTARYDIAQSQEGFSVEATVAKDEDWARSLSLKAKGVNVDYRCANPTQIKAPKQVNDTMTYSVQLNSDAVILLQKGLAAMSSDTVSIISGDEGVAFKLTDVNNDVFKHTFSDGAVNIDGGDKTDFAHRYHLKTLLALFKHNPDGTFSIGAKGILSFPINGLTVFVLPRV